MHHALLFHAFWICGVLTLINACMPNDVQNTHQLLIPDLIQDRYNIKDRQIAYIRRGPSDGRPVIFIHGSPGKSADANRLLQSPALKDFCLIAVDRPGWGASTGPIVPSITMGAQLLAPVLDICGNTEKAILVGHSLGSAIAARITTDHPDTVGGLVLVAPSLDPDLRAVRWYNRLADYSGIKRVLPAILNKSNDEIINLPEQLKQLAPRLAGIQIPTIVVHGRQDRLVEPANADYIVRMIRNSQIRRLEKEGHFVPFKQPEAVTAAILEVASHGSQTNR